MARTKQNSTQSVTRPNSARKSISRRKSVPTKRRNIPVGPGRPPTKWRPGTVALREIKKYQGYVGKTVAWYSEDDKGNKVIPRYTIHSGKDATKFFIPKVRFQLLVKQIAWDYKSDLQMTCDALQALQVASEDYLVELFRDTNLLAIHRDHPTIMVEDMRTAMKIRRDCKKWFVETPDAGKDKTNIKNWTRTDE